MWIFTKEYGSYNLDNYDHVIVNHDGTFLLKECSHSYPVSKMDVESEIREAIRNGYDFLEVD